MEFCTTVNIVFTRSFTNLLLYGSTSGEAKKRYTIAFMSFVKASAVHAVSKF